MALHMQWEEQPFPFRNSSGELCMTERWSTLGHLTGSGSAPFLQSLSVSSKPLFSMPAMCPRPLCPPASSLETAAPLAHLLLSFGDIASSACELPVARNPTLFKLLAMGGKTLLMGSVEDFHSSTFCGIERDLLRSRFLAMCMRGRRGKKHIFLTQGMTRTAITI